MPATVLPAAAALFGIQGSGADVENIQSKTVTTKFDMKEAIDYQGEVVGWAFFGKMAEHSIDMLGTDASTYDLGVTITAPAGIAAAVAGTLFCVDELSISRQNDGFANSSIKISEYVIED